MRRPLVAAVWSMVLLPAACAPRAMHAQDTPEPAVAEKAVAAANLSFPDVPLTAAARVVRDTSTDQALKARALRLLELIETMHLMGDYRSSDSTPMLARVIAWGHREYQTNLHSGSDASAEPIAVLKGTATDGKVALSGTVTRGQWKDAPCTATLDGEKLIAHIGGDQPVNVTLEKTVPVSPTLNAAAPEGAVVLFDGKNLDAWRGLRSGPARWTLLPGGVMQAASGTGGIISKQAFGDHRVHVEFRTPLMPEARGQNRGNSGVYLQGRYEVQVLDSYSLAGRDNECGGIYKVAAPKVNMCAPPTIWQTYDIEFHAARFADGRMTDPPRMTVIHNGVKIHDNQPLKPTTAAPARGNAPTGGLFLQDHGNPVQYRNIWVEAITP